MIKKNLPVLFAFGLLSLASSCTKSGSAGPSGATGPTGPAGPSYTGAISGHVSFYDQYGSKDYNSLSSTQLSLNGAAAINADVNGFYIFGGITTGDYSITASSNGYAGTKTNNFQFVADTLNRDIKLSAIPDFSPTSYTVYPAISSPGDSIVLNFAPNVRVRNCIVFINNSSTVNSQPANYLLVYTKSIAANRTSAFIVIPSGDLSDAGIASGATIYCAAYGYVIGDVSAYEDFTTGRNVYNAVSASPVIFTAVAP